ncbi:MAG: hypothetical protein ACLFPJ_03095 [Candidatus Woesearchaeota archaeon]
MGADTVATHLILFIAVLAIATGLVIGIKNFSDNAESSIKEKGDAINQQIKTSLAIEVISYNNDSKKLNVYARNIGKTNLKIDQIDIYINGQRIPRNTDNRTITVLEDTTNSNTPLVWNPNELIEIIINKEMDENTINELTITTQYNFKKTESFSI